LCPFKRNRDGERVPGLCPVEERVPGREPGQRIRPGCQDSRVGASGQATIPQGHPTRQVTALTLLSWVQQRRF
jgi:hypothetical protein